MPDQITADNLICSAKDSCLLAIDIQSRLTAAMPGKVLERLIRNSTMLLNIAKHLSIPVFATQQYPEGLGPMEAVIKKVLPEGYKHYDKTCFSCAQAENFLNDVEATNRKQIIIMGVEAHICVLQTALDLRVAGYHVFVVTDAVCSRQRDNYENAIQRLQCSGVITCNTESVLFEWLRDAKHQHFKVVSAMVRQ
jgi:isochorismate hydrolase